MEYRLKKTDLILQTKNYRKGQVNLARRRIKEAVSELSNALSGKDAFLICDVESLIQRFINVGADLCSTIEDLVDKSGDYYE